MRSECLVRSGQYLFAILALISIPISGLSIDIYVPSLPAVSHFFHTSQQLTQLTITTYMLGYGLSQFLAGAVCDSFGRKKPFIIAAVFFTLASTFAIFALNIQELLVLRFIQGFAIGFTNVAMRSVIADLFTGKEFYKMMNYVTLCWSIGPIIAPVIGGYLQVYFGWQASFCFLAIYGFMIFLLNVFLMPETANHREPFQLKPILQNYKMILTHSQFIKGLFSLGLLYTLLILFSIVGPFLLQDVLHYSPIQFGHIALLMGVAWFLGSMLNRILLEFNSPHQSQIITWLMLLVSVLMLLVALLPLNIYSIVIPTFLLLVLASSLFADLYSQNTALFPRISGTANALLSAFLVLIASGGSAFGTLLKSTSGLPLATSYVAITLVCLYLCYSLIHSNLQTRRPDPHNKN